MDNSLITDYPDLNSDSPDLMQPLSFFKPRESVLLSALVPRSASDEGFVRAHAFDL